MGTAVFAIRLTEITPAGVKLNRQYLPSISPTYAFVTAIEPLAPAAVGSAWIAFLRAFAATSPILTHPEPDPEPSAIVAHDVPPVLPFGTPVSTSSRYSAFP